MFIIHRKTQPQRAPPPPSHFFSTGLIFCGISSPVGASTSCPMLRLCRDLSLSP
ncbi:hypothetical protein Bca101_029058 [Brassica carinata]